MKTGTDPTKGLVKMQESKDAIRRDRLWCEALVSLIGDGLTTEHVYLVTKRVNEMRGVKVPIRTSFENLRLHAVNYMEAVDNDRQQKTLRSRGARMKAEKLLVKLLAEIKPKSFD